MMGTEEGVTKVEGKNTGFVDMLLEWSEENLRSYPWRKTNDSYAILIAEIMLQRTKADQVVPAYERFLQKYPNPEAISASPLRSLKSSIRSLGLGKRAQGLKRLAKQLASEFGGKVPRARKELLSLYGVGDYITNAVMCHAFGESVPTVDANFGRVLKRVFSLQTKEPAQKDNRVWSFAEDLMPLAGGRFRELNLGIIDLANVICVPRRPKCPECPLKGICDYAQKQVR